MTIDILVSTFNKTIDEVKHIIDKGHYVSHVIVGDQVGYCGHEHFTSSFGADVDLYYFDSKGVSKSRNQLLGLSKAEIITFCDDDVSFFENYENNVFDAFSSHCNALVIRFNCSSLNENRPIRFVDKDGVIAFSTLKTFGVWGEFFKRDFIIGKRILFDEYAGPGSIIVSGEDVMFNKDVSLKTKEIYQSKKILATVAQTESSWFSNYDVPYFTATGYVYSHLFGFAAPLFGIAHWVKHHKEYSSVKFKTFVSGFRKGESLYFRKRQK